MPGLVYFTLSALEVGDMTSDEFEVGSGKNGATFISS
jgi:hypothetical protein